MSNTLEDIVASLDGQESQEDKTKRLWEQRARTVIVDFNHLAHKYTMGMPTQLITPISMPDGSTKNMVTNIPNGVGKAFNRWARGGKDRLAVCFDRPIGVKRQYIKDVFGESIEGVGGYKGSRGGMQGDMYEAIQLTQNLLRQAGVSCYAGAEYEADDLIMACVEAAKQAYPGDPIDVVTNDMDLVPLVDEDVSVFLQSRSGTWAEYKWLEKNKYEQVTPENYAYVMGKKTAMKNLAPEYNTALLIKMLRGDASDNIPGTKSRFYTPTKVREIQEMFKANGVDMAETFRFGQKNIDRLTTLLASVTLSGDRVANAYKMAYGTWGDAINQMLFGEYAGEIRCEAIGLSAGGCAGGKDGLSGLRDLHHVRGAYKAMDLNRDIRTKDGRERKAARLAEAPKSYDEGKYIAAFGSIMINVKPY